jgi:hypothetical protein
MLTHSPVQVALCGLYRRVTVARSEMSMTTALYSVSRSLHLVEDMNAGASMTPRGHSLRSGQSELWRFDSATRNLEAYLRRRIARPPMTIAGLVPESAPVGYWAHGGA